MTHPEYYRLIFHEEDPPCDDDARAREVQITELDVACAPPCNETAQAAVYVAALGVCLDEPRCTGQSRGLFFFRGQCNVMSN